MAVYYVQGDIFMTGAQAIAHGCNCEGIMGKGIALQVKKRFPLAYKEYRKRCLGKRILPGDGHLATERDPWILNLITQKTIREGARLEYLEGCFKYIMFFVNESSWYRLPEIASIAMPRIGAGLGRLAWNDVVCLIEKYFEEAPVNVYVYDEFKVGVKAKEPGL